MALDKTRAVIFGCAGLALSDEEIEFFEETQPLGFILFARNCDTPAQIRDLVRALRKTIGRADAPVLIDQEGGRVQRLNPPHWRAAPPASAFAALAVTDPERAVTAARMNMRLIAAELYDLGINVNCAPVLDLPIAGADPIIGDRAAGASPAMATVLGRAACEGLFAGGVAPIMKHIPGHGRALVDSHLELPIVNASRSELLSGDYVPFRDIRVCEWAMTAHVVYPAIDANFPATTSKTLIEGVIRNEIGFNGVLISDDIGMKALQGTFAERTQQALEAGCDIVLHCSGDMAEMKEVVSAATPLSSDAKKRLVQAAARVDIPSEIDREAVLNHLNVLLAPQTGVAPPSPPSQGSV